MNGEDILFAMTSLGFENYAEALKIYLSKYREVWLSSFFFPPRHYPYLRKLHREMGDQECGMSNHGLAAVSVKPR